MNMNSRTTPSKWDRPNYDPTAFAKHSQADIADWEKLRDNVIIAAESSDWTKAEVARRADIPEGTFSQWVSGKYPGVLANVNERVLRWLDALNDATALMASVPVSPAFLQTAVGSDVLNILLYAQVTSAFCAVTLPAGRGKTYAAKRFCATRPHAYMATLSPNTKTVHGMLTELAAALDVQEYNPARLSRAIGKKLQRQGDGTLLIIDEAQNAQPDAINQLRHFVDQYQCGLVLIGNEATATAFVRDQTKSVASRAQVLSRFDRILKKDRDQVGDAKMIIRAWNVTDVECERFLLGISSKPGALRQIDRTMKGAMMIAIGEGEETPSLAHLKAAWAARDLGDIL